MENYQPNRASTWFNLAQNLADLGDIEAAHGAYKLTLMNSKNQEKTMNYFEDDATKSKNRAKALKSLLQYD